MKNKRNNNNQIVPGMPGGLQGALNSIGAIGSNNNNRDGSNDPYDNQRVDTGGGEYLHYDADDNNNQYQMPYSNNKFSPKAGQNKIMGMQQQQPQQKKKSTQDNMENGNGGWTMNFNRQGSKKGIISGVGGMNQNNFMGNKLSFNNNNAGSVYDYNIPAASQGGGMMNASSSQNNYMMSFSNNKEVMLDVP